MIKVSILKTINMEWKMCVRLTYLLAPVIFFAFLSMFIIIPGMTDKNTPIDKESLKYHYRYRKLFINS